MNIFRRVLDLLPTCFRIGTGSTGIDGIEVGVADWELLADEPAVRKWVNSQQDIRSLHLFDLPPDLAAPPSEIAPLRDFYRSSVGEVGGALIEVESAVVSGVPAVHTILKLPQAPTGMLYVGSLTIPFAEKSFVLKFQCREHGMTGVREATMFTKLQIGLGEDGSPVGWQEDPYDPTYSAELLRNRAEDEVYDAVFPDHPLTRVRRYLKTAVRDVRMARELTELVPFGGGDSARGSTTGMGE